MAAWQQGASVSGTANPNPYIPMLGMGAGATPMHGNGSSPAVPEQPPVPEPDPLVVVHVRPGSEYQALTYLLRHVNRHFSLDDVLPDPPDDVADHRYVVLAWPKGANPNGDASTLFQTPTYPSGLLLKRVRVRAREPWEIHTGKDDEVLRKQRLMPMRLLESPPAPMAQGQLNFIRRKITAQRPLRCFDRVQLLPVAIPSDPKYLEMASEAIAKFNAQGLVLTVYLEQTCRAVAAAVQLQAAWRCALLRSHNLPLTIQVKRYRAASLIQRAWRAYLQQLRFLMLHGLKKLTQCMNNLLLGGRMALDVIGSQMLRNRQTVLQRLYPEHRLRFAFDRYKRVCIVVPPNLPRGGLPVWVGAQIPTMTEAEFREHHGDKLPIYGQQDAMQLLVVGAEWQDPQGNRRDVIDSLPEPPNTASPTDCILQVTYMDIMEARSRACLLLALTFDPKFRQGVALIPPHLSSLARLWSSMTSNASLMATGDASMMHGWGSLRGTHSPMGSHLNSPARVGSPSRRSRLLAPSFPYPNSPTGRTMSPDRMAGSRGTSAGRAMSPLGLVTDIPSPRLAASPPRSPYRDERGILYQDVQLSSGQDAMRASVSAQGPRSSRYGSPSGLSTRRSGGVLDGVVQRKGGSGIGMSTSRTSSPMRQQRSPGGSPGNSPRAPVSPHRAGSRLSPPPMRQFQGSRGTMPDSWPFLPPYVPQHPLPEEQQQGGSSGVPRLPALRGLTTSSSDKVLPAPDSPVRLPPRPMTQSQETPLLQLPPIISARAKQQEGLVGTAADASDASKVQVDVTPWGSHGPAIGGLDTAPNGQRGEQDAIAGEGSGRVADGEDRSKSEGSRPSTSRPPTSSPAERRPDSKGASAGGAAPSALWSGYDMARRQTSPSQASTSMATSTSANRQPSLRAPSPLQRSSSPAHQQLDGASERTASAGLANAATDAAAAMAAAAEAAAAEAAAVEAAAAAAAEAAARAREEDAAAAATRELVSAQSSSLLFTPTSSAAPTPRQGSRHPSLGLGSPDKAGHDAAAGAEQQRPSSRPTGRALSVVPETPVPSTPNSRLLAAIKRAEDFANDPKHMALLPTDFGFLLDIPAFMAGIWSDDAQPFSETDLVRWLQENAELRVEQLRLLPFMRDVDLANSKAIQAALLRYQSQLHDAYIKARAEELVYSRATRARATPQQPVVLGRPVDTGHKLAPGYVPLSSNEMSDLVASMAEVYRAAAAQTISKAKEDHSEVMREIREEKAHLQQVIAVAHNRQSEVAATMRALYDDAWDKAKRARVNQRMMRNARKDRRTHDRAFANAFVRQTNLLAKNVEEGERNAVHSYRSALRQEATAVLRRQGAQTQANIELSMQDQLELNRWKAVEVKKTGYTREMQQYAEAAEQYNKNIVTMRRQDEVERHQRVGPAGMPGKPAASLRAPLPLSTVVSAADAKKRRVAASAPSSMRSGSGGSGGGATEASAATAPLDGVPPGYATASQAGRQDAALPVGRAWAEEDGGEEQDDVLQDYLPEFPYARGAVLTVSGREKPTGIIV